MTTIDDLIYSPIPIEEPPKTFRDICEDARADAFSRRRRDARRRAEGTRQKIEDEFHHLRGKLFTRDNPDGSVDVVHKELAAMRLNKAYRRTKYGLRRYRKRAS